MKTKLLTGLLLFTVLAGDCQTKQDFENVLARYAANDAFSGVVLFADQGKPVFENAVGYRDFARKEKLHSNDIFELASVSKQFTAMAIMMLKEKGLLQYDDPIEKYLDVPYKGITIRNLLTHTSGLPDYQETMDKHWDKTKIAGNSDILAYLNKYMPPKLFDPGARYQYSNTGYVFLASIVEKASGRDFIEFCTTEIFRKLKMKHTAIRTREEKAVIKNFAPGHIYVKERNAYVRADSFPSFNYTIWLGNRKGPGRVSSTANDLLKWDAALYTSKLVSQETLQEAFTPMTLNNGSVSNYGFGWSVVPANGNHKKIVWHNGDNPGYKTEIMRFIEDHKTLIVLSNNYPDQFANLIKDLQTIILQYTH